MTKRPSRPIKKRVVVAEPIKSSVEIPYQPLPHQRALHRSSKIYRLLRGGVGSGKTICGAYEALRLAVQNPGLDGMVIAPTWPILHRTTLRAFRRFLPREIVREEKKMERYIELLNGSRIYYGSADRPDTLEGADLAWAWGDEARYWKREAWEIVLARVRAPKARRRSIVLTTTPAMGWLYETWGERGEAEDLEYEDIVAPTEANIYLPEDYIRHLRRSYSERLYRQYVGGEWIAREGQVFPEFDPSQHVIPLGSEEPGRQVFIGLDFGLRRSACIYLELLPRCLQHGAKDCVHVLGELLLDEVPTYRLVPELLADLRRRGWEAKEIVCDPAGAARSIQTGWRDIDILRRAGWTVRYPSDPALLAVSTGVNLIRSMLAPVEGQPRLWIDKSLREGSKRGIVAALMHAEADDDGRPKKDDNGYDHVLDALRYALVVLTPPPTKDLEVV